jgi:beta-lactamase class A
MTAAIHRRRRRYKAPLAIAGVLVLLTALTLFALRLTGSDASSVQTKQTATTSDPTTTDVAGAGSSTTTSPVATQPTSPFTAALAAYAAGRAGTITAAVENLDTGQTFYFNPGIVQDEASVVKVDIMATLLAEQPNGAVPTVPGQLSLLSGMIDESDNDSATALWDQVGGPAAIDSFNRKADMTSTTPSSCVTCANFPWPGWGLTTTSASDQIALLRQFVSPDSILSAAQRSYALNLMETVEPSEAWGVSGGVPSGVTVALKNGWLPLTGETNWQVNSVGWINGDGRSYLVAILTGGNPSEQYGIDTINEFSESLWSQLG